MTTLEEEFKKEFPQLLAFDKRCDLEDHTDKVFSWFQSKLTQQREEIVKEITNMPEHWPVDVFEEPWAGWQKDVDALAKTKGYRIDNISGNYARWARKVTLSDCLSLIEANLLKQ